MNDPVLLQDYKGPVRKYYREGGGLKSFRGHADFTICWRGMPRFCQSSRRGGRFCESSKVVPRLRQILIIKKIKQKNILRIKKNVVLGDTQILPMPRGGTQILPMPRGGTQISPILGGGGGALGFRRQNQKSSTLPIMFSEWFLRPQKCSVDLLYLV